jgi:hypothetical protein
MTSQVDLERSRTITREGTVAQLSSLYRSELAARETYELALCHVALARYGDVLRRQKRVHADRLAVLGARLRDIAAQPPESSGAWGTFARTAEQTAAAVSEGVALGVLALEEEALANDYVASLAVLDPISCNLVAERLLPAQNVTLLVIRRIHRPSAA